MIHPGLFKYQSEGAHWLSVRDNAILADEMGVGKSGQAIAGADILNLRYVLVVCPGIARHNWLNEFDLWSTMRRTKQAIMSSNDKPTAELVVVSYSLLRSLKVLRALVTRKWDLVILDEAHFAKSQEAWRAKAIYGVNFDAKKGLASVSDRVWLLSGTIRPNHLGELWTHCNALFPTVTQGMGYHRFVEEYCRKIPGTDRIVGSKNEGKLIPLLKPHVLRRTAAQVLPQLPPLRFSHVPVHPKSLPPMTDEVKETAAVINGAIAKMTQRETAAKGREMWAEVSEGQMASLRRWTGLAKAAGVAEFIKEDFLAGMDKIVVFAWHRDVIDFFEKTLPNSASLRGGISPTKKQSILTEFQKGSSITTLVCQFEVASTAISLVQAAHVAFAEPPWVPKDIEQAVKRLHRQGQTRPVLAKLFSLQGSFDETVIGVLTRKLKDATRFNASLTAE